MNYGDSPGIVSNGGQSGYGTVGRNMNEHYSGKVLDYPEHQMQYGTGGRQMFIPPEMSAMSPNQPLLGGVDMGYAGGVGTFGKQHSGGSNEGQSPQNPGNFPQVPNSPLSSGPTQHTNSTGVHNVHNNYNELFADHRTPHDGLAGGSTFQFKNTNHNNNSAGNSRQASHEEQQREFTIDDTFENIPPQAVVQNENYTQNQVQNHTTFGIGLDDSQDNQNSTFETFGDQHIGLS